MEKTIRKQLEVEFVCNQASKRYYIFNLLLQYQQRKNGARVKILS